jgi:hypothetical protein
VFNEGGLFGERQGWHLPGFDASSWVERSLSSGLPNGAAGVGFFVTSFQLDMPDEVDAHMSFTFDQSTQPYRALLFVNGWMMGKRVANLGYVRRPWAPNKKPRFSEIRTLFSDLNTSSQFTRVYLTITVQSG